MNNGVIDEESPLPWSQRFAIQLRHLRASAAVRHWKDGALGALIIAVVILGCMNSPLSEAVKWDIVIALGTVTAAFIALNESYKASRRSKLEHARFREAQQVALITALEDRFNGTYMIRVRATAAESLLRGDSDCVSDVIDFFETLGLLSSRGLLDKEMLWSLFYDWALHYLTAAKDIIDDERKDDETTWSDAIDLLRDMEKVQLEKARAPGPRTPESIRGFLLGECSLRMLDGSQHLSNSRQHRGWRERAAEVRMLRSRHLR